jgi:hypothetical protein
MEYMQLIIGIIIGIVTVWVSSGNKTREIIYNEKMQVHKRISTLCSMMILGENDQKTRDDLLMVVFENIHILSKDITESLLEFSKILEGDMTKGKLVVIYARLAMDMKKDLHIDTFHKITGFLVKNPIHKIEDKLLSIINKRDTPKQYT